MAASRSTAHRLSHQASQPSYHRLPSSGTTRRSIRRVIHPIYSRACPTSPCHGMSAGHLPHCCLRPGESTAGNGKADFICFCTGEQMSFGKRPSKTFRGTVNEPTVVMDSVRRRPAMARAVLFMILRHLPPLSFLTFIFSLF